MSRQSFLDPAAASDAAIGSELVLGEAESHHARVKRIAVGEGIDVVDGAGTRCVCIVTAVDDHGVRARVESIETASGGAARTLLVQALSKGDRDLQAVETCVEIGVGGVIPWQADRSIVRWKGERAAKAHAKWESQVVAAVKQSRRENVPALEALHTSNQLAERLGAITAAGGLALILHEAAGTALPAAVTEWLGTVPASSAPEIALVVGPEGGISPQELARFEAVGAVPVLVGRHVLRASTAGAVGLVLTRSLLGEYA